MNLRDKKLIVFHQLSQEDEPLSVNNLLERLGSHYSERSVRRWLAEMVKDNLIEPVGRKKATKYRVLQHTTPLKVGAGLCFSSESMRIIEQVHRPLYVRTPALYNDEWFEEYKPNKSFYIPTDSRAQLHRTGKRAKHEDPAGTYAHQIFNRLLIDLSYNSSRLEGNTYSWLDTERLILKGTPAEGKLDDEKIMILNHKEAIRYLVDNAHRLHIAEETIYTLHFLLSDGLLDREFVGKVRPHSVRIGGSTYIPIENSMLLKLQLERIVKKASLIEDPYEQSLFLLIHISYLQAFADVNKRTARLAANIPLVVHNLVPQSFSDIERDDYNSALIAVYELQDVRPMVDLYLFSYMRTCTIYDSTVRTKGFDEIRVRYRKQRRALLREIITKGLKGNGMMDFLNGEIREQIPHIDRESFLADIVKDLEDMNEIRLAGLGVTLEQLHSWQKKHV
ncbi:MAG: Fic family protein [Verrucomicrobia bacterium]|nr:Fic family protein [Verrucomicrobiota bacterium]